MMSYFQNDDSWMGEKSGFMQGSPITGGSACPGVPITATITISQHRAWGPKEVIGSTHWNVLTLFRTFLCYLNICVLKDNFVHATSFTFLTPVKQNIYRIFYMGYLLLASEHWNNNSWPLNSALLLTSHTTSHILWSNMSYSFYWLCLKVFLIPSRRSSQLCLHILVPLI